MNEAKGGTINKARGTSNVFKLLSEAIYVEVSLSLQTNIIHHELSVFNTSILFLLTLFY